MICPPTPAPETFETNAYSPMMVTAPLVQQQAQMSQMRTLSGQYELPPLELQAQLNESSSHISFLPRSESMEVANDPRFMANSVIAKRLAAFQTISVVAVLMVNLSVKQMFSLQKDVNLGEATGIVQYVGFLIMSVVFLMDLFTVIVIVQQLFMTYRLLTAGPTGFEAAKAFYLESNIVSLRHLAVKGFLCSLPLFVASTSCMIYVVFAKEGNPLLAIPSFLLLAIGSMALLYVNCTHAGIFKDRYCLAKSSEQPLLSPADAVASRNRTRSFLGGLDV